MECSCGKGKFCKKCYSNCYYLINRDKILNYQKKRYQKNKQPSGGFTIIRKPVKVVFS